MRYEPSAVAPQTAAAAAISTNMPAGVWKKAMNEPSPFMTATTLPTTALCGTVKLSCALFASPFVV